MSRTLPRPPAWPPYGPFSYHLFDIVHLDGHDTTDLRWSDRRSLLESLVEPNPWVDVPDPTRSGGRALLDAATERGLEGLVAKRTDSTYRPGTRSSSWLKIKIRRHQELVIGGWSEGTNSRTGKLGAVLVGWYDDDGFHYAGRVGSGLSEAELARLAPRLGELSRATSPFAEPVEATRPNRARIIHWVEPELVGEIAYSEWSAGGRLRHPA
ncbi:MAG: DNA ligase, partial [Actinomycetia bacterium]|nr:DNA ligase [Actinomycetes bacterium]